MNNKHICTYGTKSKIHSEIPNIIIVWQFQVDLRHNDESNGTNVVEVGVDLSEFYQSVEWDVLEVPAVR